MIKKLVCLAMSLVMVFTITAVDASALGEEPDPENVVITDVEDQNRDLGTRGSGVTAIDLTATSGIQCVTLTWEITGEAAQGTEYNVMQVTGSGDRNLKTTTENAFVVEKDCDGNALAGGTEYTFKIVVKDSNPSVASAPESATPTAAGDIAAVENLGTIAGHKAVTVKWDKIRDGDNDLVDGYNVYRNGVLIETFIPSIPTAKECTRRYEQAERTRAKFEVAGFKWKDSGHTIKQESSIKSEEYGAPVSALYVTFKAKAKKPYYKKSKGKAKAGYLSPGKTYTAQGFVCGRLRVMIDNKIYYYPRVYSKNISMKYVRGDNYTEEDARNFVNQKGLTSRTNYMVWISLYQQHIYFFKGPKGSKGNWTCINDWEVSTGQAKSATATGEWVVKKKHKKKRGLWYWTTFYSGVSLHSWGNPKCFGAPHSGGCVRMTKSQAQWAWKTLPKGTKVLTY